LDVAKGWTAELQFGGGAGPAFDTSFAVPDVGGMSIFEFTFALMAVILGLALTQVASSFQRLALAGPRVRWAPEPMMLTLLLVTIIVTLWLSGWQLRSERETTVGLMLLAITKLILPYMATAAALPENIGPEGKVDLLAHYDSTRRFTYGTLSLGLVLGPVYDTVRLYWASGKSIVLLFLALNLAYLAIYIMLMWVRVRWVNIVALALVLASGVPTLLPVKVVG
jgi:hypothetical protein